MPWSRVLSALMSFCHNKLNSSCMGQNDIDSDVGNICDASYSDIANASSLFKINDQGPLGNFKVNS